MAWEVVLYETEREGKPVEEFIKSLEKPTAAKISHLIDLLEIYGSNLGSPHSKKIKPNLFELRVRGQQEVRIFYFVLKSQIFLLSGFKKQSRKTPKKEIDKALDRLGEISL